MTQTLPATTTNHSPMGIMPIAIARATLLLLLLTTLSCRDVTLPEWELRVAQGRWARNGSDSYRIIITRSCFCPPAMLEPVIVEVVDGAIQSLRYADTGDPVPAQAFPAGIPTIDGLFEIVDSLRRDRDARLAVVFDPTYGYPASIRTYIPDALDSGMTWEAHDLVLR